MASGLSSCGDDETIHVFLVQKLDEFSHVARVRFGSDRDVGPNVKARKFCSADGLDRTLKRIWTTDRTIVSLFAPCKFKREKKPRIGPKFVNALPQVVAARVEENVAVCCYDGVGEAARLGMQQRFDATNPNYGRRNGANAHSAFRGRMPLEFR